MIEFINRWFGRATRPPGAFACGVRHATGAVSNTIWETRFPEATLTELWHRLETMTHSAAPMSGPAPETFRWLFTDTAVLATARPDGAMCFILAPRKSGATTTDEKSVNRLLCEFRALRA